MVVAALGCGGSPPVWASVLYKESEDRAPGGTPNERSEPQTIQRSRQKLWVHRNLFNVTLASELICPVVVSSEILSVPMNNVRFT